MPAARKCGTRSITQARTARLSTRSSAPGVPQEPSPFRGKRKSCDAIVPTNLEEEEEEEEGRECSQFDTASRVKSVKMIPRGLHQVATASLITPALLLFCVGRIFLCDRFVSKTVKTASFRWKPTALARTSPCLLACVCRCKHSGAMPAPGVASTGQTLNCHLLAPLVPLSMGTT